MNISVNEEALAYIREKGGSFYLATGPKASMCCGRVQFEPTAEIGIPRNKEGYCHEEVTGVTMYVPQDFLSPYPLTIVVSRFLGFRKLAVDGWKLI